ncbi:hypothetical protein J6590_018876 [Homalodisca vitripennis]|nr:hypothetical protein J6590_018876 [Homalodisca vitripennis]
MNIIKAVNGRRLSKAEECINWSAEAVLALSVGVAPISAGPLSAEMTVNHGSSVHRHWSVQCHILDPGYSTSNFSRLTRCRDDREPRFQRP